MSCFKFGEIVGLLSKSLDSLCNYEYFLRWDNGNLVRTKLLKKSHEFSSTFQIVTLFLQGASTAVKIFHSKAVKYMQSLFKVFFIVFILISKHTFNSTLNASDV